MAALDNVVKRAHHVVTQVVEAQLVIGAVSDVAGISFLTLCRARLGEDNTNAKTQPTVHTAHHLGVTLSQVIVDRNDVNALTFKCVEVSRQQRGQRLTLTGTHLGNVAEVEAAPPMICTL